MIAEQIDGLPDMIFGYSMGSNNVKNPNTVWKRSGYGIYTCLTGKRSNEKPNRRLGL